MAKTHNLLSSKGLVGHALTSSFLLDALCFCRGLDDVQKNKYCAGAELGVARAASSRTYVTMTPLCARHRVADCVCECVCVCLCDMNGQNSQSSVVQRAGGTYFDVIILVQCAVFLSWPG